MDHIHKTTLNDAHRFWGGYRQSSNGRQKCTEFREEKLPINSEKTIQGE